MFNEWGIDDLSLSKIARDSFYSFFFNKTEIYPEAASVLQQLRNKNIKIGVLTDAAYGSDKRYITEAAEGLKQHIDVFLASTEVGFRKPHTKGYLDLAKELEVIPSDCLFVGDEVKDVVGANKAGMISVLINRANESRNYGQKYAVKSLNEILDLVDLAG